MKARSFISLVSILALVISSMPLLAQSQGSQHAVVVVPDSTVEHPGDVGFNAHTNHLILVRPEKGGAPQATSPRGETPQTVYPVYLPGASVQDIAGSQTIAIVDAFDYPTAENDLNVFSAQFGLPACTTANGCFTKVFANGSKPRVNCGWAQEAALDIEWAHAMAPQAKIVLVEAATNSFTNLFKAIDVATSLVTTGNHQGQVSMSWGGSEFSSEAGNDGHFQNTGVVYFGSSGDTGGATIYPSASPYVVAVGGTTLNRDNKNGNFVSETGWSGSGGGPSKYETKLSYQDNIAGTDPTQRSIPDMSFDADPNSGVSVYDSTSCQGLSGWLVFGGTSVSSPSLAGIVNRAGSFATNSVTELTTMYKNAGNSLDFYDVLTGTAGSFTAKAGWDFVTGIGSSRGTGGK